MNKLDNKTRELTAFMCVSFLWTRHVMSVHHSEISSYIYLGNCAQYCCNTSQINYCKNILKGFALSARGILCNYKILIEIWVSGIFERRDTRVSISGKKSSYRKHFRFLKWTQAAQNHIDALLNRMALLPYPTVYISWNSHWYAPHTYYAHHLYITNVQVIQVAINKT